MGANWLLVTVPSDLLVIPEEWGFVPLVVEALRRRGPGRLGFRRPSWAGRKAEWRAGQGLAPFVSGSKPLVAAPQLLRVEHVSVFTQRSARVGFLRSDQATVSSKLGALGSQRQGWIPRFWLSDLAVKFCLDWVNLNSSYSHILAK